MTTYNHGSHNRGISHLVWKYGQRPLCGSKRAIMAVTVQKAMEQPNLDVCKRCADKLIANERKREDRQADSLESCN